MFNYDYIKQTIKIKLKYFQNLRQTFCSHNNIKLNTLNKYAFVFFAADYNNLGDLAITYAQEEFIRNSTKNEYQIIKINVSETYSWIKVIKQLPINNVLITLIGGGNNGSLYEFIEEPRRFILKTLKNYKIISFPQTVFYENTLKAIPYQKEFIKLCEKCNNLTMIAREQISYIFYKQIKDINVLLTPDIVFSLHPNFCNVPRKGIAFIFRDDKEKMLNLEMQDEIIAISKKQFNNTFFWDTCDITYKKDNEKKLLEIFLNKLQSVQLVVTDRLHGMILCYISHTPCIVIDNKNGKIKATFDTWLKDQNFIKMLEPFDNIYKYCVLLQEFSNLKEIYFNNNNIYFDVLKNIL